MNAQAMLADFLEIVTPKSFHKHLLNSADSVTTKSADQRSVQRHRIGRGIESLAQERHCINRADGLLSHTTLQQAVPEFYTAVDERFSEGKTTTYRGRLE
ncbi:MAG: hypothetical protein U5L02_05305 [Rheinheimera sp.]|nr:hypothetical protein [Rheinheimera sp.]